MIIDRRSVDDWEWSTLCLALDLLAGGDFDKAREAVRTWETYRDHKPAPRKRAKAPVEEPESEPLAGWDEVKPTPAMEAAAQAHADYVEAKNQKSPAPTMADMLPKFLDRRGGAA